MIDALNDKFGWVLVHFLPTMGFVLAVVLLARILHQRRSPTSTVAWLLAIVFIPYLGVPLYLMLGGRKMVKNSRQKSRLTSYCGNGASQWMRTLDAAFWRPAAPTSPALVDHPLKLLTSGDRAFEETLKSIGQANRHICIATFILGRDATGYAVMEALAAKAAEGVSVYLLMDALGSHQVRGKFLEPLRHAGGQTAFFMPMLHLPFRGRANLRNHRKMLLVDGRSAIVGGMNLAADYMAPAPSPKLWRDLAICISDNIPGPLYEIFASDWAFAARQPLPSQVIACGKEKQSPDRNVAVMASGPDCMQDNIREAIITLFYQARERIWIVTPYFVPDEVMLDALSMAARRGVDLRIIIPRRSNHRLADWARESYLNQLQEDGAAIHLFEPTMLHAKAVLLDTKLAIVGSANMDMRSMLLNYEVALTIRTSASVAGLDAWMRELMTLSVLRPKPTPHLFDIWEGIGRLFAPLL